MPDVHRSEETVARLDALHEDGESDDELVADRLDSYEAEELTVFHSGDS